MKLGDSGCFMELWTGALLHRGITLSTHCFFGEFSITSIWRHFLEGHSENEEDTIDSLAAGFGLGVAVLVLFISLRWETFTTLLTHLHPITSMTSKRISGWFGGKTIGWGHEVANWSYNWVCMLYALQLKKIPSDMSAHFTFHNHLMWKGREIAVFLLPLHRWGN